MGTQTNSGRITGVKCLAQGMMEPDGSGKHQKSCVCQGTRYRYYWLWRRCMCSDGTDKKLCFAMDNPYGEGMPDPSVTFRDHERSGCTHCDKGFIPTVCRGCNGTRYVQNVTLEGLKQIVTTNQWKLVQETMSWNAGYTYIEDIKGHRLGDSLGNNEEALVNALTQALGG